jgi:hypothetical protein
VMRMMGLQRVCSGDTSSTSKAIQRDSFNPFGCL